MDGHQFNERQRAEALELVESLAWGDVEHAIYDFETALALALEAVGPDAIKRWDAEGDEHYGDEFQLSPEQIAELEAELRLAYIARMLQNVAHAYGVPPAASLGRSPDGYVSSPLAWRDQASGFAQLARGLNDIRWGLAPASEGR